jgi:hypothetical protein
VYGVLKKFHCCLFKQTNKNIFISLSFGCFHLYFSFLEEGRELQMYVSSNELSVAR